MTKGKLVQSGLEIYGAVVIAVALFKGKDVNNLFDKED